MFRIKKGDVDSVQLPPCKFKVPLCFMLCGPIIKRCVWKIYFEPKKDTNSQEGHGWMIEDGQLLFDRMSDPLVVMELIVCKCNRMCKGPECQWFSNALMYEPVNCDNLIDGDFEDSGDDTGDEYESD